MKYFSAFAGAGGFEQGMPKDWECIGFSEIDKYANIILEKHYPNVRNYGDITKIDTRELPKFDLLVGGSPCQDLSLAGKRKGLKGERSGLFFEYCRILKECQPSYFIWENVKGTLSSNGGRDFAIILNSFSECGYELSWQVLNAKFFGVPQNRERIFIVGHLGGTSAKQIFFEQRQDKADDTVPSITATYHKGDSAKHYNQHNSGGSLIYKGGVLGTKNKKWLEDGKEFSRNFPQGHRVYGSEGIATNLSNNAGGWGGKTGLYAVLTPNRDTKRQNGRRFKESEEEMFMLTGQDIHGIATESSIRRLTPLECERLMGWEDNWTEGVSDTQRYKLCGNGVVSNVVKELVRVMFNS